MHCDWHKSLSVQFEKSGESIEQLKLSKKLIFVEGLNRASLNKDASIPNKRMIINDSLTLHQS